MKKKAESVQKPYRLGLFLLFAAFFTCSSFLFFQSAEVQAALPKSTTSKLTLKSFAKSSRTVKTQTKKSAKRLPSQHKALMKESKEEINSILSSFKNSEGAQIRKVERLSPHRYKIEIVSKSGHCDSFKVAIKNKVPVYDLREYHCD